MLISGIGDEVLGVFVALLLVALVVVLWRSTDVQEWPVQAWVIRTSTSGGRASETATIHVLNQRVEVLEAREATENAILQTAEANVTSSTSESTPDAPSGTTEEGREESPEVSPVAEASGATDSAVENISGDVAEAGSQVSKEANNSAKEDGDVKVKDSCCDVDSNKDSSTCNSDGVRKRNVAPREGDHQAEAADVATIKVRFIDETSIEVREKLGEKLGAFVSKHLDERLNLSSSDRVKLIYNGRVLRPDQSSLSDLGLTDNCVVHCLVQRQETTSPDGDATGGSASARTRQGNQEEVDLDLGSYCFPLLGLILAVIWSCQVIYAHYFNFSSTAALVLLTVLFIATTANNYIPVINAT